MTKSAMKMYSCQITETKVIACHRQVLDQAGNTVVNCPDDAEHANCFSSNYYVVSLEYTSQLSMLFTGFCT
jgi:hypothetical protein